MAEQHTDGNSNKESQWLPTAHWLTPHPCTCRQHRLNLVGYLLFIKAMQRWTGDPLVGQRADGLWDGVGTGLYIIHHKYVRKFLKKKKGKDKGTCSTCQTKQVMPSGAGRVYLRAVYGLPRCCLSKIKCPKSSMEPQLFNAELQVVSDWLPCTPITCMT